MKTKSANVTITDLTDGRQVCLSYGVIVAAFIPRGYDQSGYFGYLKTDRRFSVTTSKHMNQFTAGHDAQTVDHDTLVALCAPVQSRQ